MKLYILKIDKFKRQEGKKRHHEGGRYLLEKVMDEAGCRDAQILIGEHGKPYLEGKPLYFNISHSGDYVVLVVGKNELGVDIQEKKTCRMEAMVKRFFAPIERQTFEACGDEAEKETIYYHIWCRKEAYGKYLGVGLNEAVLKTDVLQDVEGCCFREYDELEGYQISICCGKEEEIEEVISVLE